MSAVAARSLSVIVTTSSIVAAYHGHTGTDNDKTESFQNINVVGGHDTYYERAEVVIQHPPSLLTLKWTIWLHKKKTREQRHKLRG